MEKIPAPTCCNLPTPGQSAACDPGYNTKMATIIIKDVYDRFRVDLNHRKEEFEQAAAKGQLSFRTYPETQWVEVNGRQLQYNTVLECNGRISYYFWIELLKREPKKKKK